MESILLWDIRMLCASYTICQFLRKTKFRNAIRSKSIGVRVIITEGLTVEITEAAFRKKDSDFRLQGNSCISGGRSQKSNSDLVFSTTVWIPGGGKFKRLRNAFSAPPIPSPLITSKYFRSTFQGYHQLRPTLESVLLIHAQSSDSKDRLLCSSS